MSVSHTHTHTHTYITHQELPQVFVVGDDAVVDDDELWRQRKGPAQPHPSTSAWQRAPAAAGHRQQRPQSFIAWKAILGRIKRGVSPPAAIPLLYPWLVMAEESNDAGGTTDTEILQSFWRHSSPWQFPACWKPLNPALLLPVCRCCSWGSYTTH